MNYNQFAWYYDSLMEPQFYEDYFHFIKKHATFKNVLDFGCGTGRIENYLKQLDINIEAFDLSSKMIEIAKEQHECDCCHFYEGNMLDYKSKHCFDLVLCCCDSLNYVLGFENQVKVLQNAYHHLNDEGTFIFDIHSPYKMNVLFENYIEEDESEDFYFYWKVKKTSEYQITHYVIIEDLEDDIRTEEKHVQESYPIEWYIKELNHIGFKDIIHVDDFQENQRIIFVCKK